MRASHSTTRPTSSPAATVGDALLAVHKSYLTCLLPLVQRGAITGMAHITGGGLPDNVPRVLPQDVAVEIDTAAIPPSPICELIVARGKVAREEAYRVLNMGVGMVVCVRDEQADEVTTALRDAGEAPFALGRVVAGNREVRLSS